MASLPFTLIGGIWRLYRLRYRNVVRSMDGAAGCLRTAASVNPSPHTNSRYDTPYLDAII